MEKLKRFLSTMKNRLILFLSENIRRKLITILLIILILPLVTFLLISTQIAKKTVEDTVINSNLSRVELSSRYLNYQLNEFDQLLFSALVDEQLVPSLSKKENIGKENSFNIQTYVQDKLFNLYNSRPHINAVTLVSYENGTSYQVRDDDFFIFYYPYQAQEFSNKQSKFLFTDQIDSFSYERPIFRFEDRKLVGKIKVDVRYSLFDPVMNELQSHNDEQIFLLNSSGKVLYHHNQMIDDAYLQKLTRHIKQNRTLNKSNLIHDGHYYSFYKSINDHVILLKIVPERVMNSGAIHIRQSGWLILALSIVLTVIIAMIVASRTTKPIVELATAMETVRENNLTVNIDTHRKDEIGILSKKFKEMTNRISDLIEKDYKREIDKKNAQFLALQAQINPHFLYNTLQVISGMAIQKNAKEVSDVTQKLSQMFRYITKKQNGLVQLDEELSHVKNYLYIQQSRFRDKVSIEFFIDNDARLGLIPMLTIQPMVENCFIHGFHSKSNDWKIKIDVQRVFDEIEIIIEDNGNGMSKEKLTNIRKDLLTNTFASNGRIGLRNVHSRIRLYFGNEYGIELFSEENEYTKVIVRIPYQEKGVDRYGTVNC